MANKAERLEIPKPLFGRMSYSAGAAQRCNNKVNRAFSGVSHGSVRATSLVQTDGGTSFRTGVLPFSFRLS